MTVHLVGSHRQCSNVLPAGAYGNEDPTLCPNDADFRITSTKQVTLWCSVHLPEAMKKAAIQTGSSVVVDVFFIRTIEEWTA